VILSGRRRSRRVSELRPRLWKLRAARWVRSLPLWHLCTLRLRRSSPHRVGSRVGAAAFLVTRWVQIRPVCGFVLLQFFSVC